MATFHYTRMKGLQSVSPLRNDLTKIAKEKFILIT